ncbi:MAG: hypothetical protein KME54_28605 [Tolypothrix brevis GSE-NOS-MK-07-07A]|nr:hypothetical protein [Tolypothrix brevis GSE-NOS-MK-07-07A]
MKNNRTLQAGRKYAPKNAWWLFTWALKRWHPSDSVDALSTSGDHSLVERDIILERIRQARLSFNLTLTLMAVNTFVTIVGVGLLLLGNLPEGTVITAIGLASNIVADSRRLDRDTSKSLDKLMRGVHSEEE